MKAIVVKSQADSPRLIWQEVPEPEPGAQEVLVEVHATAVNRADLLQARGMYPPPPGASEILGLEMAGEIVALGQDAVDWQIGDRVCALLSGGGYAERVTVPRQLLLKIPDQWTFLQAAAIPEVWLTAFVNLFLEGRLCIGETVLIHAGASGVGTAAIQMAREIGATVFVTAGAQNKLKICRELGAALTVNYKEQDFCEQVQAATEGRGVDLILDPVGGNYLMRNLTALAKKGRLVNIGLLSGGKAEIDLALVLTKNLRIVGSTLRPRPLAEKTVIVREFRERFWPLLADGKLRPIIDRSFPIQEAQAAHEFVAANRNAGKVVLEVKGQSIDE
jgi:putative PIG3 family NAD(P)H quinone oxidoreductase